MNYLFHILIMINIYIILTVSTNLMVGVTNLLSMGQAAFYGLGAYFTVLALMVFHLPLIPTLLFAMLATALVSLLLAWPSLRLRGDYFVLASLGFQLITFTILYNWVSVTRGPFGIPGIPAPELLGLWPIRGILPYLVFSLILAGIVILVFRNLLNSPFGRVLKSIREDEIAVHSLGRDVTAYKIWVFVISSAFIALAGTLFATYITYIDPTSFNLDEAIFILAAVLIGGTGNTRGPIAGAVFVVLLPELLRFVGLPDAVAANLRQIIYGLSLILLMRWRPQGIAGNYQVS